MIMHLIKSFIYFFLFYDSAGEELEGMEDTLEQTFYRRSLDNNDKWLFTAPIEYCHSYIVNETMPVVMATKVIQAMGNSYDYLPAGK